VGLTKPTLATGTRAPERELPTTPRYWSPPAPASEVSGSPPSAAGRRDVSRLPCECVYICQGDDRWEWWHDRRAAPAVAG
jgi:hypothetical protein